MDWHERRATYDALPVIVGAVADVRSSDGVENHSGHTCPGDADPIARERRLASLAARQYRAVGHDQLLALGFSYDAIRYRLRAGRLQLRHSGVYIVGPGPPNQRGRWYAALLATRPHPALSHLSSTALRGLGAEGRLIHVTTATRSVRKLRGVTVHRARQIDPADLTRIDGLPVTALARTLLDLAETEPYHRLEKIFEEVDRRGDLDLDAIGACIARNPGRRGLRPLTRLLDDYLAVGDANEGLERLFQRFLAEERFPQPQTNVLVAELLVDCYWPEHNFVVELDSRDFHSHWVQQERDRVRDGTLLRAGVPSLRVTYRRITRERDELVADLASQLPRG